MTEETQYLNLLSLLAEKLKHQKASPNRTGVDAASVVGYSMRFDLSQGVIPLLTTKHVSFKSVLGELLWFLRGETRLEGLHEDGIHIWDAWATTGEETQCPVRDDVLAYQEPGRLGPIYGKQWRAFPAGDRFFFLDDVQLSDYIGLLREPARGLIHTRYTNFEGLAAGWWSIEDRLAIRRWMTKWVGIDQIAMAIHTLRTNPTSRRVVVTAWNPQVVPLDELSPQENVARGMAALASCHCLFQLIAEPMDEADSPFAYRLSCVVTQRSADVALGVPFNIASYATLVHLMAKMTGMAPGELVWNGGSVHLYANHLDGALTQLERTPSAFPTLHITQCHEAIDDYTMKDFEVCDYHPQGKIAFPIAV